MTKGNDAVRKSLNLALGMLFELEDAGCTVTAVQISSSDKPTLRIDRRPPASVLRGAHVYPMGGFNDSADAADLRGCSVEWRAVSCTEPMHRILERQGLSGGAA